MKLLKKIWQWIKRIGDNIAENQRIESLWEQQKVLVDELHTNDTIYQNLEDKRKAPGPALRVESDQIRKRVSEIKKEISKHYDS